MGSIFEYELGSKTDFQKDLHDTTSKTEPIICNHYKDFKKCTWTSTMPIKMNSSLDGDEVVYQVFNTYHFLNDSYMKFTSPVISVIPEHRGKVQICWCRNMGTNIVKSAVFKENNERFNGWDYTWADMYSQYFPICKQGGLTKMDIGMGNIPQLIEWNEELPKHNFNVIQPWFYSFSLENNFNAFPIFYKGSNTRAEHRYTFRQRIVDLLRVRVLQDGKWVELHSPKQKCKYVGITTEDLIKTPELWGEYSCVTEAELEDFKTEKEYTYYYRDVVECDASNPTLAGKVSDIQLFSRNPCLAMFWVAENQNALKNNNYSNYTTNTDSILNGQDPIEKITLKYGDIPKFDGFDADHFTINQALKKFPSSPRLNGYYAYSNAANLSNFDADIGVVYTDKVSLKCKLAGPEDDDEEDEDKPQTTQYQVKVRLLVLKRYKVKKDDKGNFEFSFK